MKFEHVVVKDLHFDLRPNTSDAQAVKEVVEKHGYTRRFFQIEQGEHWLDLGANIGAFSCFAAQKGAKVTAYEAEAKNAALADHNIRLNDFEVEVHQQAVVADGIAQKTVNLYLSNTDYGQWRNSLYKTKNRNAVAVEAVRISDLLPNVDAIKMDIEGAEIDILFSIADFQAVRKLVFEYHFDVNRSIPLFMQIVGRLKTMFQHVHHPTYQAGVTEHTFFPPAAIVFCWND